jgi:hypothetical protein
MTDASSVPESSVVPPALASPSQRRSPLSRLRVGSEFTTRKGAVIRVQDVVVLVSSSGSESPSVIVERIVGAKSGVAVLTVGIFANQIRSATHKPGTGPRVDWAQVPRRPHGEIPGPGVLRPLVIGRARHR